MQTSVPALVTQLKANGEDHEFYPTTNEIIKAVVADLKKQADIHWRNKFSSVLDIGAGHGKVLLALREAGLNKLHAIEKSPLLCRELDDSILIVGTDFHQQSLLSKDVDVVFCNPPYSEFEDWTYKIIREAASHIVYLVIPVRWEQSIRITDAIRFREAKAKKLGQFTFEDSEDRNARAVVNLVRLDLEKDNKDDAIRSVLQ
jgi:predicted RNA methylase